MKKCILIPDSFKGTMSSTTVCEGMEKVIKRHFNECVVKSIPVADGGEGTTDCFLHMGGYEKVELTVLGPLLEPVKVYYARKGCQAVIELAAAAGLPLIENRKDPVHASTYGVGQMIMHAILDGCTQITLGLGGSCTNDGGTGMARALGTVFYNQEGKEFAPFADEFTQISAIDTSKTARILKDIHITAMCDIDNPMYGEEGAAYVFAPQKGADKEQVEILDQNLKSLSEAIKKSLAMDVSSKAGSGAAGAAGAGVLAFLGGELKPGIQAILSMVHFEEELKGTDMIFTGEGKIDGQSLRGKVVVGVSREAKKHRVPVIAIVGAIGDEVDKVYEEGVTSVFSINTSPLDYEIAKLHSIENLERTMDSVIRLVKIHQ